MLYNFCFLFSMFLVYSFIGYLVEVCYCSFTEDKLVLNRGFLIGPILPIYGISVVLMYVLLYKYKNDIFALFIMSCFICSIMEFFTSLVLEKIFKVRWWDYSDKKFNIDGRICLSNSLLFGLGGVALFYVLNPVMSKIFELFSQNAFITITMFILDIFILDVVVSIIVLVQLKLSSIKFSKKDVSEELIELRNEQLMKNSLLLKRLLNAFPKVEGKNKEMFIEIKKQVNDIRRKLKESKKLEK